MITQAFSFILGLALSTLLFFSVRNRTAIFLDYKNINKYKDKVYKNESDDKCFKLVEEETSCN